MSFYGDRFIFDGIPCEEFGLMLYDVGSTGQQPTSFASNSDFMEDRINARYDPLFYGIRRNSQLNFQMMRSALSSRQAEINMPPRIRMATLYAVAQSLPHGGRVANTCNYSEDYVGYSTKFGDSAGDFSPLASLTVHEVRQIGYELPLPKRLVDKTPSDGLCGKTDEDNLGMTYRQLDDFLEKGTSGDEALDACIHRMHLANAHKLLPMPQYYLKR